MSLAAPLLPESAQLAADFWRQERGLDVEVKVGDRVSLQKALLTDELHGQVTWIDNTARADPANLHVIYYGTSDAGSRLHGDPALFEADNQTVEVYDPAKRNQAYNNMHRRLREETYELGIGYFNIPWAVGLRVLT